MSKKFLQMLLVLTVLALLTACVAPAAPPAAEEPAAAEEAAAEEEAAPGGGEAPFRREGQRRLHPAGVRAPGGGPRAGRPGTESPELGAGW